MTVKRFIRGYTARIFDDEVNCVKNTQFILRKIGPKVDQVNNKKYTFGGREEMGLVFPTML